MVLRVGKLSISDKEYIELRDDLKWFQRFYNLGTIELVDKSKGIFFDLREISSSLKVHYKWLSKFFKKLFEFLNAKSRNSNVKKKLTNFSNEFLNVMVDADKFRKIRKKVKKLLPIPSPHFSEDSMNFHEKLRTVLKKLEIVEEDLVDLSKTRLKIVSIGLEENLTARERVIDICIHNFKNNETSQTEDLLEVNKLSAEITELKELDDNCVATINNSTEIEIWPIYEFFFMLFTYRFQRKLCEEIRGDVGQNVGRIYEETRFRKFEEIPTIPIHLIALMKTLNSDEILSKRRISLLPELFSSIEEFSERSFAVKNSDVLLHWYDHRETDYEDSLNISQVLFLNNYL